MVAFQAPVRDRSVSATAARLGLSPPAMSGALVRLRALPDDEPLVRSRRETRPTRRARELEEAPSPRRPAVCDRRRQPGRYDPTGSPAWWQKGGNGFSGRGNRRRHGHRPSRTPA
jgi:hypothetical protein